MAARGKVLPRLQTPIAKAGTDACCDGPGDHSPILAVGDQAILVRIDDDGGFYQDRRLGGSLEDHQIVEPIDSRRASASGLFSP
ncbi:hypothetical protein BKK80_34925 (plasmid) [Cupriavidus malaysiensis]|uniref:Uncharacterized protein n=1 Tax=Cupriavidus malaysiensis TaxID=367825 RepID=A0ABN4U0J1_9BURK|nr:hypothetical protein BKK80_34925 [Cupriavidus malaysiensis]